MIDAPHLPMEDLELFKRYVQVAHWAWRAVNTWDSFARDTVGRQLVRACDSIGANLVEGDGRKGHADSLHFFIIARASAREARYWLQIAAERELSPPSAAEGQISLLTGATQLLNRLIRYRRAFQAGDRVREVQATYELDEDPFSCDLDDDPAGLSS